MHTLSRLSNGYKCIGIVPALILTIFLGVFALFTAKLLVDFKLNHPDVHGMGTGISLARCALALTALAGDAGYILFGPIGREVLGIGTIIFAICATVRSLTAHPEFYSR